MKQHTTLRLALLLAPLIAQAAGCAAPGARLSTHPGAFNVRDFGAVGDARANDSAPIAKAIDAASRAAGGGTVHFPPGQYLTGPIHLKSHVALNLDADATILFSTDLSHYPVVKTRFEGTECYSFSSQVYGRDLHDIAITGRGALDGQGRNWWQMAKQSAAATARLRGMADADVPVESRRFGTEADALRPSMIQFISCKNVLIEGVRLINAPMWTVHPIYCDGVTVRGVNILGSGPNTDGIDPDSCRNVLIEKCRISTGDDCIAIKSGRDHDGRCVAVPCERIIIRDCLMERGHAGVAIGSEMSAGVRHVSISNCTFLGSDRGIRIKTMRGRGGIIEDIHASNITMSSIKSEAVILTMNYQKTPAEPASQRTPTIRNIRLIDITCNGAGKAVTIDGLPERAIEDVTLANVRITAAKGLTCADARRVQLANVHIDAAEGPPMTFKDCAECAVDGKPQP